MSQIVVILLPLVVLVIGCNAVGVRPKQSAGVKGILTCDGKPAAGVLVKLYDKDRGGIDDKMAEGRTDSRGSFQLSGHARELTDIDPKLYIYHDCNDGITPCQRRFGIMIPDKYISEGATPRQLYDAGTIELSGKFSGETRDCIH